ncbi:hypothetical protein F990_03536 [Acinetobacter tjernbergiae DSM 14971 = CIP 107465]|uniref:Uncharacterized protein n=1 Tax=Acinetobacter tjernbergiae DSM 14971 = CIP 107465 TaxID=1120928 RepID=V2UTE0_9GAMM|nr:hypothetical protein F990_03536 [Acinetobacter tjernbergiae DSM 14971 = CIP 107465]
MYVCKLLTSPDELGLQTCMQWVEFQSVLSLTADQRDELMLFFFTLMLTAYSVVQVKRLLRR